MSVLTLYIFRQVAIPLLITTLTLSFIVWIVRALRSLDQVVLAGQPLLVWGKLLLYSMPQVVELVLPYAFLISALYTFHRLFIDSEVVAMFVGGVSRTRLMRPILMLAALIATLVLLLGFYGKPWATREATQHALEINTNVANAMLRPGIFTNPARGFTAFVRSRDEEGFLQGIFFQDGRDRNKSVSYTAESGALVYDKGRTNLIMFNGHIQYHNKSEADQSITLVKFERYSYDLAQLVQIKASSFVALQELYPHQLYALWNSEKTSAQRKKAIFENVTRLLLKALYTIAYAFVVLAAFLPTQIKRDNYNRRIYLAALVSLGLSFGHFPFLDSAFVNKLYLLLIYFIPVLVISLSFFIAVRGSSFWARWQHRKATTRFERSTPALSTPNNS